MKITLFKMSTLVMTSFLASGAYASQQELQEEKLASSPFLKRAREENIANLPKSKKIKRRNDSYDSLQDILRSDGRHVLPKKMFDPTKRMTREQANEARILLKLYKERYPEAYHKTSPKDICHITGIKKTSIHKFMSQINHRDFHIIHKNISKFEEYINLNPLVTNVHNHDLKNVMNLHKSSDQKSFIDDRQFYHTTAQDNKNLEELVIELSEDEGDLMRNNVT